MMIAIIVLLIVSAADERVNAQRSEPRATKIRIAMRDTDIYGALFVTIAGTEEKATDHAQQAWIINDGRHVVYSSSEGAGGYENEGQSLHLYDLDTRNHKRIMSEYFMVQKVKRLSQATRNELYLSPWKTVVLVLPILQWLIPGEARSSFAGGFDYSQTMATLLFSDFTGRGIGETSRKVKKCGLTRRNVTI
jgi:hypothetical protein